MLQNEKLTNVIQADPNCKEVITPLQTTLQDEEIKNLNSHYKYVKSKCSCKISDIQGFMYGGMTSRFWVYRKHILSMDSRDLK